MRPRIGVSACFFHADPERPIFKNRTLLYLEESMGHYVMAGGAVPYLLPTAGGAVTAADLVDDIDGLVLQGGSDVSPRSYDEEPLRDEWQGDAPRDRYEIELVRLCLERGKPILGICRGLQLINVALGGSLYQDIRTQNPDALVHRDWYAYDELRHPVRFEPGCRLAELYGPSGEINSVHHQAIKDVAADLRVEATSPDGIVEAARLMGSDTWCFGVQWHPEFQRPGDPELIPRAPLMDDFLSAVREAKRDRSR